MLLDPLMTNIVLGYFLSYTKRNYKFLETGFLKALLNSPQHRLS